MKKQFFVLAAVLVSIQLNAQQDTTSLDDVVVTASKFSKKQNQTGKVVTVIGKEQLAKSSGQTLSELLNMVSGTTIIGASNNLGTNQTVSFRGSSAGNVLILLDGIPINDPSVITNYFDLNFIAIDQLERIEILKGGQSTLYGSDAVAGVINLISKKSGQKSMQVNGTFTAGNYNTMRQSLGMNGRSKKINYSLNYTHTNADGFSTAYDSSHAAAFEKDGFNQHNLNGRIGIYLTQKTSLNLTGMYSKYITDLDATAFTDEKDYTATNDNRQIGIGLQHQFKNGELHFNFHLNKAERAYLNDSSYKSSPYLDYSKSNYTGRTHFTELYSNWAISKWEFLVGVDYRHHQTDQWYWSKGQFGPYAPPGLTANMNQLSSYATAIFSAKNLTIEAGSRLNTHSEYGTNITFTLNPSFIVGKKYKLFGNLYSAYKTPTLYQLFDADAGNANLRPENGIIAEIGASLYQSKKWQARLVGFFRNTKDAILYTVDPTTYQSQYMNAAKQINYGAEWEASYTDRMIKITCSYTYTSGKTVTGFDGTGVPISKDTSYFNLYRIPKHALNLNAGIQVSKPFYLSSQLRTISRREEFVYGVSPAILKSYTTIDLYGEYSFEEKATLFLTLKNITNKQYFDILGYNSRKFNFTTGVRFQL